jgi:hypothetical protein
VASVPQHDGSPMRRRLVGMVILTLTMHLQMQRAPVLVTPAT